MPRAMKPRKDGSTRPSPPPKSSSGGAVPANAGVSAHLSRVTTVVALARHSLCLSLVALRKEFKQATLNVSAATEVYAGLPAMMDRVEARAQVLAALLGVGPDEVLATGLDWSPLFPAGFLAPHPHRNSYPTVESVAYALSRELPRLVYLS